MDNAPDNAMDKTAADKPAKDPVTEDLKLLAKTVAGAQRLTPSSQGWLYDWLGRQLRPEEL